MRNKLTPLIIVGLLIAIVIVIAIFYNVLTTDGPSGIGNSKGNQQNQNVGNSISLEKKVDDKDKSKVIINVSTTSDASNEIKEIHLPNGEIIVGQSALYTVEENGTYIFKAISNNGEEYISEVIVEEIEKISATNPYVPEGFTVINDVIEEGFVIEDSIGNQYVWIPVSSGKLIRETMLNIDYEETSGTASALVNSVAKYYGFYIAKYEASEFEIDGQRAAASMNGKNPWTNITYLEAAEYANNSSQIFGYTDCTTALMNSYAWDTTLSWLDEKINNYSSSLNYGNYTGTIYPTGSNELDIVNNISDLSGNVREWTTEIYKSANKNQDEENKKNIVHRVVRGGSANLSRTPASHIYYPENTSDNYWGFRTILFK